MKKLALSLIGALGMLLLSGSAFAQAIHVRMDIPFDFTVNNKTLSAGQYEVLSAAQANNPNLLEIRHLGGSIETYVSASDVQSSDLPSSTKLVFRHYGNMYFLSQMWTAGTRAGREFPKARAETEQAKNGAGQQITLAAKN
jgi:hypothetical protein